MVLYTAGTQLIARLATTSWGGWSLQGDSNTLTAGQMAPAGEWGRSTLQAAASAPPRKHNGIQLGQNGRAARPATHVTATTGSDNGMLGR
jgi:hypothetical protein